MTRIAGILCVAVLALVASGQDGKKSGEPRKDASDRVPGLVRAVEAVPTRGDWSKWLRYFRGETHGTCMAGKRLPGGEVTAALPACNSVELGSAADGGA